MPKRKLPFDWDTVNRKRKAGKAEAVEAERARKAAELSRGFNLRTIAEKDARDEQERLERIAAENEPCQFRFSYPGMNNPRKVVPRGQHDFRPAPYQTHQQICCRCGKSKWAADKDWIPCPEL